MHGPGVLGMAIALSIGTPNITALAAPPENARAAFAIAQLQLTDQRETAEDLILDALEEQPATADAFLLRFPDLTDAQQTAIRAIYADYETALTESLADYLDSVLQLNQVVNPVISNNAIQAARQTTVFHEQAVYDLLFRRTLAIRAVLSPEQRPAVDELLRSLLNLGTPTPQFPLNLIGQSATDAKQQLEAIGWELSFRTPGVLLFDLEGQQLDLTISSEARVEGVLLRNE